MEPKRNRNKYDEQKLGSETKSKFKCYGYGANNSLFDHQTLS